MDCRGPGPVQVLKSLHRYAGLPNVYEKALHNVPHPMRTMFLHSYCSSVWNHAVAPLLWNRKGPAYRGSTQSWGVTAEGNLEFKLVLGVFGTVILASPYGPSTRAGAEGLQLRSFFLSFFGFWWSLDQGVFWED